ncbi:Acetolactate synthase isozyme 1 small subunit [compost metagenome]|nr:Acetolactate synthase isozyme 1 small subunit [Serratia fonticola]
MPLKDGTQSRIWLLVADDQRLVQMISQVEKLEDVLQVKRHNEDMRVFEQLEAFFQ